MHYESCLELCGQIILVTMEKICLKMIVIRFEL